MVISIEIIKGIILDYYPKINERELEELTNKVSDALEIEVYNLIRKMK